MLIACGGASVLLRVSLLQHGADKLSGLCDCFGWLRSLSIWIHWAAASAHACKRVRISPSAPALITAWCGQETWSLRLLWFALLARHVDPLGCCVSSCMQACVRGSVHELVASALHGAVLQLTANIERLITTNRPKLTTRTD